MGGHAGAGTGRLVDGAEGSHEGGLERDDAAGEEGWSVTIITTYLRSDMCVSAMSAHIANRSKTAYWIAFGPHGPRAMPPPGEGFKVFLYTMYGVVASGVLFATVRYFARGPPDTFTKEHQEATTEYLKVRTIMSLVVSTSRDAVQVWICLPMNTCTLLMKTVDIIPSRASISWHGTEHLLTIATQNRA